MEAKKRINVHTSNGFNEKGDLIPELGTSLQSKKPLHRSAHHFMIRCLLKSALKTGFSYITSKKEDRIPINGYSYESEAEDMTKEIRKAVINTIGDVLNSYHAEDLSVIENNMVILCHKHCKSIRPM